jgi:hypothetical protein
MRLRMMVVLVARVGFQYRGASQCWRIPMRLGQLAVLGATFAVAAAVLLVF